MNKFSFSNSGSKTNPFLITSLSLLLIIIPYALIWILFGEGREIFFIDNNIDIKINEYWFNIENRSYSWEFYTVFFSFLFLPIIIYIVGKFIFNIIELDAIPFFYLSCGIWISVLLTGIMPINNEDDNIINLIIFGKFIFIIVLSLLFFLFFNFIVNIIMLKSKNASIFFRGFKEENDINNQIINSQKTMLDERKKKDKKETSWIV